MNKKAGLPAVFLVVLIDLMGFGIVLPLLPYYASQFQASPFQIGLLYSVYSFSQLIFSPIWGALSDRIGRRPVMLVSTVGSTASYILVAFSHSLGLLFFSRILATTLMYHPLPSVVARIGVCNNATEYLMTFLFHVGNVRPQAV